MMEPWEYGYMAGRYWLTEDELEAVDGLEDGPDDDWMLERCREESGVEDIESVEFRGDYILYDFCRTPQNMRRCRI